MRNYRWNLLLEDGQVVYDYHLSSLRDPFPADPIAAVKFCRVLQKLDLYPEHADE